MNWITLIIAGLFEVFWAISMKFSHGFTKLALPTQFGPILALLERSLPALFCSVINFQC